ncbi:RsmB/NOP family class I SAM-dependent RNA methyltransferase [Pseudoruegeria sp. SHC-113]|uniref:RsmB/NOP family class I SAM-dependent RNA methyltransferase n=1 Tax=Pseudoruegeria sp. SHC-113 TaxID=2855439 RepID=UPI0021BAAB43|nr:RsmB/NOP family class I SAM-dependent RNA methyltransferase [Pseudoruegeria sp. SHC-113]MCT8160542.1 RsmB/NOP family class I SAM-dependent RNA methyltransferase [Pseudoruegeria sp. SHC-113]
MTPAARIAAAIGILDQVLDGVPAEKALTGWARGSRFAGSKDRAAVRDHVFDALRCKRSFAWLGGAMSGRGLLIGALRSADQPLEEVFTGEGHAPAPLTGGEAARLPDRADLPESEARDLPDWVWPRFEAAHGKTAAPIAEALRHRAPVFLRVNIARQSVEKAQEALLSEGVETRSHPLSPTALEVTENARRVQASKAYQSGGVELQDAGSQALVDALPLPDGGRVLDFCAGGGGKSLAMAARCKAQYTAHDVSTARMRDLPARAARAGVQIGTATRQALSESAPFDLVLADAPCSGTGAWRRSPDAKWRFFENDLQALLEVQAGILLDCAQLVKPGGTLAYATCSLLAEENAEQVARFCKAQPDWQLENSLSLTPLEGGDGFFLAVLRRK